MIDDDRERAELFEAIHVVFDMRSPETWTAAECRQLLDLLTDLAAAALSAEIEEVGR